MLPETIVSTKIWATVFQKKELWQDKKINKSKIRNFFDRKETRKLCIYYKAVSSQTLSLGNLKMCILSYNNYDMKSLPLPEIMCPGSR